MRMCMIACVMVTMCKPGVLSQCRDVIMDDLYYFAQYGNSIPILHLSPRHRIQRTATDSSMSTRARSHPLCHTQTPNSHDIPGARQTSSPRPRLIQFLQKALRMPIPIPAILSLVYQSTSLVVAWFTAMRISQRCDVKARRKRCRDCKTRHPKGRMCG